MKRDRVVACEATLVARDLNPDGDLVARLAGVRANRQAQLVPAVLQLARGDRETAAAISVGTGDFVFLAGRADDEVRALLHVAKDEIDVGRRALCSRFDRTAARVERA